MQQKYPLKVKIPKRAKCRKCGRKREVHLMWDMGVTNNLFGGNHRPYRVYECKSGCGRKNRKRR